MIFIMEKLTASCYCNSSDSPHCCGMMPLLSLWYQLCWWAQSACVRYPKNILYATCPPKVHLPVGGSKPCLVHNALAMQNPFLCVANCSVNLTLSYPGRSSDPLRYSAPWILFYKFHNIHCESVYPKNDTDVGRFSVDAYQQILIILAEMFLGKYAIK